MSLLNQKRKIDNLFDGSQRKLGSEDRGTNTGDLSFIQRHDNRLLRDTVAKFMRILPVFDEKGLGYLGPMPGWFQCENNCDSCRYKVALTYWIGWPLAGKGYFRNP